MAGVFLPKSGNTQRHKDFFVKTSKPVKYAGCTKTIFGQMYKYLGRAYKVAFECAMGQQKKLGGILQGTRRINKAINLELLPGSGGQENGFYKKNRG